MSSSPAPPEPDTGMRDRDTWPQFLLRYGLPGFIGTALVAIGAIGVGWLPLNSSLHDADLGALLRDSSSGLVLSRLMIAAGIAVLLQTWLVTGYDLLSGLPWRPERIAALVAVWSVPLLFAPPLFSRDVYSYFGQGRLLLEGYDPYASGVSVLDRWFADGADPMWGDTPAPYGPFWLMLARGVAEFAGENALLGAIMFRLLAVIGVAMMAWAVPALARQHGIDPSKAVWIAVANPLVIMHFIAGAHNDALMTGLMLLGFLAACRGLGSALGGAALVGLAAAVKPIAFLSLPFIGILLAGTHSSFGRRIVAWIWVTLSAAAAFGICALMTGTGLGWLSALSAPGEVKTWLSPPTALGMIFGGALEFVGLTDSNDGAVAFFRAIGLVLSLIIVTYLCLRPQGRSALRGTALAFGAVILLGPVIQPWYLLWALPLFAVTGLSERQLRWTVLLTAAFAVHGMAESSATSDTLLELTDLVAIGVAIGIVALILLASPRERKLVLKDPGSHGLHPESHAAQQRAEQMVVVS
ncbi:MAG: polyprenol phosphomannose-dependent alpha 1,6 mannosyltransferase MptB [Actinomycetia bacterium]|nr:polyprenol phosphomannose-dependent alpha 1,6 mannosyltransferase MptB [Actinomycetes bacterium]